jgi:hypothetical protein
MTMNEDKPKSNRNPVRGISLFLGLLLFIPAIKEALDIKLFKWQGGFIGLYQLTIVLVLALLLWALIYDEHDKIEIPFFNKFFKND